MMTDEEFDRYLSELNEKALVLPLVNCQRCLLPIVEDGVVLTRCRPPIWFHLECDPTDANDETVFVVARGDRE